MHRRANERSMISYGRESGSRWDRDLDGERQNRESWQIPDIFFAGVSDLSAGQEQEQLSLLRTFGSGLYKYLSDSG